MGVHDWKVVWYPNGGTGDKIDITDAVKISDKEGLSTKTSTFEIPLKNTWLHAAPYWVNRFLNKNVRWRIAPDDVIKIYADRENPITETSAQLLMVGDVLELKSQTGGGKNTLTLKSVRDNHSRTLSGLLPNLRSL